MGALEQNEYEIIVEIGVGICLPKKTNYHIKVSINDFFVETKDPKECKENYCRWSERLEGINFKGPYKSIEELDRIYIYLMDGSTPVCYWKG